MKLPRGLARFNKVVTNRVQGVYAWIAVPWAVILHEGRRSGRGYRTPVLALKSGGSIVVPALYGEESDWVRNLLAANGGRIVRAGRTHELHDPRIVTPDAVEVARLRAPSRAYARMASKQLVARLGERRGGFGPPRRS